MEHVAHLVKDFLSKQGQKQQIKKLTLSSFFIACPSLG